MSEGYYDPQPRIALEEPLLLVGLPGSGVAHIARAVCATTGLAFNDVERSAESASGRSRSLLLLEEGIEALRSAERRAVGRALERRPPGVVASDGVWLEAADAVVRVEGEARVVYVRRPPEVLLERIVAQLGRAPGSLPDFLIGAPRSPEALAAYFEAREASLARAPVILDAGARHVRVVADELRASLGRIIGTSAL